LKKIKTYTPQHRKTPNKQTKINIIMKTTTNNKLAFAKKAVAELNDRQLENIHGGSMGAIIDYIGDKIKDMIKPQV